MKTHTHAHMLSQKYIHALTQTHTHTHTHTHTQIDVYIYVYIHLYTQIFHAYLKENVTVCLLGKCLGGLEMKNRNFGKSLDELILFFFEGHSFLCEAFLQVKEIEFFYQITYILRFLMFIFKFKNVA